MKRIIEVYVGEYASGKSENAVHRALSLKASDRKVTLVDLDLVEPFYTLRPIKKILMAQGIDVIAWETGEIMGLGETGVLLHPAMKWALKKSGDIIFDVGYGVKGREVLNLVEGAGNQPELFIIAVINTFRPMTSTIPDIINHITKLGSVNALLNNTHLGDETTGEIISQGERLVKAAAYMLGLPVVATSIKEDFKGKVEEKLSGDIPVRYIKPVMPQSFW